MIDPKNPNTIKNERTFSFSPRNIFAAFERTESLAQWWGPKGFTNTFQQFEFRPGGRCVYVMHAPNGADYPNETVFREITPHSKIVIDHVSKPEFTLTVTLTPHGDETHLLWEQDFGDPETAKRMLPLCKTANEENLDRLQAILAKG